MNNTTTTYVATGLSATITPIKSNSKIVVLVAVNGVFKDATNSGGAAVVELRRDSTALSNIFNINYTGTNLLFIGGVAAFNTVDSPGVATATTYSTHIKSTVSGSGVGCNQSGTVSHIVLMEISQ